jgi:hypothetical protein
MEEPGRRATAPRDPGSNMRIAGDGLMELAFPNDACGRKQKTAGEPSWLPRPTSGGTRTAAEGQSQADGASTI